MNDPLLQQLHDLPDAEPADALWARVADARQRQIRRQHGAIAGGTAACAVLAATLFFNFDTRFTDVESAPAIATTATHTSAAFTASPSTESLHRIDRELQLAYARNADDAELASLWEVRQDILLSRPESVQPLGI